VLGTELQNSLTGIDRCRSFFDKLQLMDYLESINKFYLEGKGKITEPVSRISTGINETSEEETNGFVLKKDDVWGGIKVSLQWNKEDGVVENEVNLGFFYYYPNESYHEYFQLYITGGSSSKTEEQEGGFFTGKSFYRKFFINPPSFTQEEVDSILLNFTNELLEAKFL
jgi:hypothetical protein